MKVSYNSEIPGAIVIEGHIQGLSNVRSLGEKGIPVFVVDKTNCIARYSKYCSKFFICPDFSDDSLADFLELLAIRERIKGWTLFPSNDHAVLTISRNKDRLEKYFKTTIPTKERLSNIFDKLKLIRNAEEIGIPVPFTKDFIRKEVFLDDVLFPALIKGRYGLAFYKKFGRKAFIVEDMDSLKKTLKAIENDYSLDNIIIQEEISHGGLNKTISFTAFCNNGTILTYWMGEKVREHPLRFGTATFARSIYIPECLNQSSLLLKNLEYTGICEVEYILDPGSNKYKLIEINARTWLWVNLARKCGIDYAILAYNYLNGIENKYPKDYIIGINWVNLLTDIPFSFLAFLRGYLNPLAYFKSFRAKTINAIFSKNDIMPAFSLAFLSVSLVIKRT